MDGRINVSVANMYADATYQSEVISQALLGETINIQDQDGDFSLAKTPDGYSGWISNYQWVEASSKIKDIITVRTHFTHIHDKPEADSKRIRDLVLGSHLEKTDQKGNWIQVRLPDGTDGWLEKTHISTKTESSRKQIVEYSHEFLGYPYFWGGRSPKGFDCSGLVQTVYQLAGISLRRDSWMQHHDTRLVSEEPDKAQPGDLYFFAEGGKKITHVGIAIEDLKILHCRGYVRLNSLKKADSDFDENLLKTFVDSRTCFE